MTYKSQVFLCACDGRKQLFWFFKIGIFACRQKPKVLFVRWHFIMKQQRLAVWLVADFEALSYQITTAFDTSCAARITTAPAINYTACWQLVFIHICLFVIHLASIYLSFTNCTNLSTKHKFILFFCGSANPKALWANRAGEAEALL